MNKKLIYRFVEGLALDKNRKNVVYNLITKLEQEINKPDITLATSTTIGGIKIGYVNISKKYPVQLDSDGKAYVEVPWTDTNTTYSDVAGATSSTAGNNGLVPAPPAGAQIKFLRGDGTWQVPKNTTYSDVAGATSSTAGNNGLVPAPPAGAQIKFLRGDGTWQVPKNTTYSDVAGATSSTAGNNGLVPAPPAGAQTKFLRGDGTWQVPMNTTYNLVGVKDTQGLIKNGSDVTSPEGYVPCPIINGIPYYKEPATPASAEPAVAVLEREK